MHISFPDAFLEEMDQILENYADCYQERDKNPGSVIFGCIGALSKGNLNICGGSIDPLMQHKLPSRHHSSGVHVFFNK